MTTDQVLNTIPFGIGVAASTRVGNMLGARNARGASRSANIAAVLSIVAGAVVLVILMCFKDVYAKIFSDDEAVIDLTSKVMPYVALFQIADGLNGSCGGALRGMGRQHTGAMVNIVSYYFGMYFSPFYVSSLVARNFVLDFLISYANSDVENRSASTWHILSFLPWLGPGRTLGWTVYCPLLGGGRRVFAGMGQQMGRAGRESI